MNDSPDHRACPFFQGNDQRCARRFNLQQLSDVFGQCLDDYACCPVFHQLRIERCTHDVAGDLHAAA